MIFERFRIAFSFILLGTLGGLTATTTATAAAAAAAIAGEIDTNAVQIHAAPAWLTTSQVDKVVEQIQSLLEWDIRKVQVKWYTDQADFQKAHGFGANVVAFARRADNSVHIGPKVNQENFAPVFGHELVHVIIYQKYKDAIPKWLEEGLANYLAKKGDIDYPWLAAHLKSTDVTRMEHPFQGFSGDSREALDRVTFHYMASQAVTTMIASRCSLTDLLQLSVGKKLETYLSTLCEIQDVNGEFRKWVEGRAKVRGK